MQRSVDDREQFAGPDEPSVKPSFNAVPAVLDLIDRITELEYPGWLRCGAGLLALSGDTQQQILEAITELNNRVSAGGDYHDGDHGSDDRPCAPRSVRPFLSHLQRY